MISNKFIDVKKKGEHPSTQEVYKGWNNQEQKLQESKNQEKIKMIDSAMQPTNPLQF